MPFIFWRAAQPEAVKALALIDPKLVEFRLWQDCGILYADIATSVSAATHLLDELLRRLNEPAHSGQREIHFAISNITWPSQ